MLEEQSPYRMSISLNVLNHLGIGLYSNIPAVLSEVVANAWDADAEEVYINIDLNSDQITIYDSGRGMTQSDINNKYLMVGYSKRIIEPGKTPKGRDPMGRKGIGKLSVFSIAGIVEIYSVKDGERNALRMSVKKIQETMQDGKVSFYKPEPLDTSVIDFDKGTLIILRDLKKGLSTTATFLRKRLARRFSVIGPSHKFEVFIDDEPISPKDRDYYDNIEFLWCIGDESVNTATECKNLKESFVVSDILEISAEEKYKVKGWIGTVNEQKSIDDQYEKLKDFIWKILKSIQNDWTGLRNKIGVERALTQPVIKEWYNRQQGDNKKYAGKLFGKIESLNLPDQNAKKELYKASLMAFEKLALRNALSVLDNLETEQDFEVIAKLFQNIDELESAHYYEIVKSRIQVVRELERILPGAKERVLQKHVFDHLWLLDPSWERASSNFRIEEAVTTEFNKIDAKLTDEEKSGRIDIRYRTAAGKHIIIELKKYDRSVDITDLIRQIRKYKGALEKCLRTQFPDQNRVIECICLLGSPPEPLDQELENINMLRAIDARYMTYDTLVQETLESYREYLIREKKISELTDLLDSLDYQ